MKRELLLLKIFFVYILIPVLLFAMPVSTIEGFPSICLYKNIFGKDCPGCGMTRAVLSLLHLHFAEAFAFNRMIVIVFPLIVFLFFKNLIKNVKQLINSPGKPI
ncbi:MAG: DUF2752 domain-containing protein [Candidatus Omnitrophica bacterium]|nr:DUF2752 domain-containing protein [Candidatus Omnitrophota bacterium]